MTELAYEVPAVGEKHQASDPRVTTALTEIRTVLNGRLTANNFASETLTPKKFIKPGAWTTTTFGKEIAGGETFEIAATEQNRLILLALVVEMNISTTAAISVKVGEALVAKIKLPNAAALKAVVPVGPFRVLGREAVKVEVALGGQLRLGAESSIATQSGVA